MALQNRTESVSFDVIGIGNAIVDIITNVDETFLNKHSLKKGSMILINEEQARHFYSLINNSLQSSGGSAANTLSGIAKLKGRAGFLGRVRNDELGDIFIEDIRSTGAIFNTPPAKEGPSTARCIVFVTPDAQRTMCTYLGASVLIEPKDLDLSIVKQSKVLYLEGYLWDNDAAKRTFINAAEISKQANREVALSLSDSFCVDRHRKSFKELIESYVDILFANEDEIKSLYQTDNLDQAITNLEGKCKVAIITLGAKGSIIIEAKNKINIQPYKLGPVVDTTGAGDLYAGGFLYGYTRGNPLKKCGEIGSICAAHIVTKIGSRSNLPLTELIKKIN